MMSRDLRSLQIGFDDERVKTLWRGKAKLVSMMRVCEDWEILSFYAADNVFSSLLEGLYAKK